MLYAIEANGRAIFYGTDAGPLFQKTWQVFRERKMRFDVAILDHTMAPEQRGTDHLCAQQVIEHANRMRAEDVLHQQAHVFATHIAHEGNPAHSDLEAFAMGHGYEVAYDGLVLKA